MAQPGKVLIVDDSPRIRAALRAWLALWPEIEVVGEAMNGEEAIRLVEEHQPAIVLMDLEMPFMDGIQATRLIKSSWPAVNVVAISMNAASHAAAIAAGATAFVRKGDTPEQLRTALGLGHVEMKQ